MKNTSTLFTVLCSSILFGCASSPVRTAGDGVSASLQAIIDKAESLYRQGRQLHWDKRLDEAELAYRRALTQDPDHLETQNAMAALNASRGDLDRAIKLLTALSEKHPEAAHVFGNLGYAYLLKGEYLQSQEALERALSLDPQNEHARNNLQKVRAVLASMESGTHVVSETSVKQPPAAGVQINEVKSGVYTLSYPEPAAPTVITITLPESRSRHAPASRLPTQASLASKQKMRIAIINGNGITGLARAVRGKVASDAWRVVMMGNHEQYNVKTTRIEYDYSYFPAARQLADEIGVAAELRPNYHQSGSSLRVVLGRDFKNVELLRQRLASLEGQAVY